MEIGRIFSRSLELLWKYKFLWLFGVVMGLTGGSGGGGGNGGNANFRTDMFSNFRVEPTLIALAIIVGIILLVVWAVLFFYFRFVSRGALVAAVRDIEAHGTSTLREAWNQGRTFYTRLLGLGFLVNLPLILFSILIIVLAFIPIISLVISAQGRLNDSPEAIFGLLGVGGILGICCAVLCLVIVTVVIHPLYEFAVRAIVLEDLPVRDGLRRGVERVRENVGNVVVLYLLLMGARLGWALVVAVIAVPTGIVLLLAFGGALRFDLNALILILLIAAIPLWLVFGALEGIFQAFESNVWTEAYLHLLNKPQTA